MKPHPTKSVHSFIISEIIPITFRTPSQFRVHKVCHTSEAIILKNQSAPLRFLLHFYVFLLAFRTNFQSDGIFCKISLKMNVFPRFLLIPVELLNGLSNGKNRRIAEEILHRFDTLRNFFTTELTSLWPKIVFFPQKTRKKLLVQFLAHLLRGI